MNFKVKNACFQCFQIITSVWKGIYKLILALPYYIVHTTWNPVDNSGMVSVKHI